jgi:hypothetical protein
MPLIPRLRDHLVVLRRFHHRPHFGDRMCQWLLAIHMLSQLHRRNRQHRMRMIRRGHDYRIDALAHLVQHPSVIDEHLRLLIFLSKIRRARRIHIAQRHNIFRGRQRIDILASRPPQANARHVQFFTGRKLPHPQHMARHD